MKRRFLAFLAVLPLLAGGCASMLGGAVSSGSDIDDSTTLMRADGSITWAAKIDQFARVDADNKAIRQRQVTEQQTQWVSTGAYDYEFNSAELKVGIAQGKYKLGKSLYKGPGWYAYEVLIPKKVNVTKTVTETDQKLWQQTYADSLKKRQDIILSKYMSDNYAPAGENASPARQKIIKRLEERFLKGLIPSVTLVYGGWTGGKNEQENVLVAYIDDTGSFVCEWHY